VGRHRSDPRGLGRYLLLGVVAVVALALVVAGVIALRGALSSKRAQHTPSPSSLGVRSHTVPQSAHVAVLLIKIVHEPCRVFVKNADNNTILQTDNADMPLGAMLQFDQIPLQVQISDPNCAHVDVHGQRRVPGSAARPWIFTVES